MTKPTTRPAWAAHLPDRYWLFCEAYVSELSGVEAALAAGFGNGDRKNAREKACQLRKRPEIQDAINRLLAERVGASKSRVIDEISSIAFAEAGDQVSVSDKLNALGLLSKVLGLMVNKQEISGPGGKPISLEASTARERLAAKLEAMAARLPEPNEQPITLERVGEVYRPVGDGTGPQE